MITCGDPGTKSTGAIDVQHDGHEEDRQIERAVIVQSDQAGGFAPLVLGLQRSFQPRGKLKRPPGPRGGALRTAAPYKRRGGNDATRSLRVCCEMNAQERGGMEYHGTRRTGRAVTRNEGSSSISLSEPLTQSTMALAPVESPPAVSWDDAKYGGGEGKGPGGGRVRE